MRVVGGIQGFGPSKWVLNGALQGGKKDWRASGLGGTLRQVGKLRLGEEIQSRASTWQGWH